jgi:hypothetical protein
MATNSTHKKVSTASGKNASIKKDGYAKGGAHESMIPTKQGKPYSGPVMATGKHV